MGGFTTGNGGDNGGALPSIPVPDFREQGKQFSQGVKDSGWIVDLVTAWWLAIVKGTLAVLRQIVDDWDYLFSFAMQLLSVLQGNQGAGAARLIAETLMDLLGVEHIDPAVIQKGFSHGYIGGARAVGAEFFHVLLKELEPAASGAIQPKDGLNAAETFLGFVLGYAIRQGNTEFWIEMIPEEYRWFIGGLREYGELMAKNLGLGRLTRLALQPLFKVLIQDPLTWQLNQEFHPTRMGEGMAIKAWAMGKLSDQDLATEISYAGYDPKLTEILQNEFSGKLSVSDVERLNAAGRIDEESAIFAIRQAGVQQGTAALMLDAERRRSGAAVVQQLVLDIRKMFLDRFISAENRDALWSALPLPEIQRSLLAVEADTMYQFPTKRLSLAEMQTAFVQGIIDLSDLETYLSDEGYSSDDRNTLAQLTLLKLETDAAKIQLAKYAYAKAKAKAAKKGEPPPPPPAILATAGLPGILP